MCKATKEGKEGEEEEAGGDGKGTDPAYSVAYEFAVSQPRLSRRCWWSTIPRFGQSRDEDAAIEVEKMGTLS